ncbi:MAG: RluA family pseudouridine synthase [Actinomycetales bacterium]|nr:RluA family pseudouridine synthase [Actinomycetales bacterium]
MSESRLFPVPDGLAGERVDAALARMLGISRSRAGELTTSGLVLLDGRSVAKSDRLPAGGILDVTIPDAPRPEILPTPVEGLAILHQDADIIVIDKPVGVAAHASPGWSGPTVLGALLAAGYPITTSGAAERQGIVQRLDVGTSGVMVVAQSEQAYSVLKQAFRDRVPTKVYHALVQGHPDPSSGTIDAPIGRHPGADFKMAVTTAGRHAVTHYRILEMMPRASLLEVHLETGRTHQIRVHMAAIRHPCVGDLMYGADPVLARRLGLERQWLHAVSLSFPHPRTGALVTFTSPYPADLASALEALR